MTIPSAHHAIEIEMKLSAGSEAVLAKTREIFVALAEELPQVGGYTSYLHYYDTADLDLRNNGVMLRTVDASLPHFNNGITIKTAGTITNGILTRAEHNVRTPDKGLHLDVLAGHPAETLLESAQGKDLLHWFTTITRREEVRAVFIINDKRVVIECAFDYVAFQRSDDGTVFHDNCEIELEFKPRVSDPSITLAEAEDAVRQIAGMLQDSLPQLTLLTASRADIGFGHFIHTQGDSQPQRIKKFK